MRPLFLPILWWRGHRYRARLRCVRWRGWHVVRDDLPEGHVYRLWLGWWLLVVMVDRGGRP